MKLEQNHVGAGDNVINKIINIVLNLNIWVVIVSMLTTFGVVYFIISQNYKDYSNALEATKEEALSNFLSLSSLINRIEAYEPEYYKDLIPQWKEGKNIQYEGRARENRVEYKTEIDRIINLFEMSEEKYKAHQLELSEDKITSHCIRIIFENHKEIVDYFNAYVDNLQFLLKLNKHDNYSVKHANQKYQEALINAKIVYMNAAWYFFHISEPYERDMIKNYAHSIGINVKCFKKKECVNTVAKIRSDLAQEKVRILSALGDLNLEN